MDGKVWWWVLEWLWAGVMAGPVIVAYIVADRAEGWVAVAATLFVWVAVVGMIVAGLVHEYRAWREVLDEEVWERREDDG